MEVIIVDHIILMVSTNAYLTVGLSLKDYVSYVKNRLD